MAESPFDDNSQANLSTDDIPVVLVRRCGRRRCGSSAQVFASHVRFLQWGCAVSASYKTLGQRWAVGVVVGVLEGATALYCLAYDEIALHHLNSVKKKKKCLQVLMK